MTYNFALIGAAGYIAPRHMQAIKETGQNLVAAVDTKDSVGIIDSFFPDASFFTEFERFDRHSEMLRRKGDEFRIHYVSICSPNYLHDAHIRFALRERANAICEKPLVLNPWNAEALQAIESETGSKVNTVLQLRYHPTILELKSKIDGAKTKKKYDIELVYITPRGKWYNYSWKGSLLKSGGVSTNIGIHFFDMLTWIFGNVQETILHFSEFNKAAGRLELEKADVKWFLSIDRNDLPAHLISDKPVTYRSIKINGEEIEFSSGFTNLHTITYREILNGNGYGIIDAFPSIDIAYRIRNSVPIGLKGEYHPMLHKIKK
jgi:UDP-N-acetyl-2-amino-2-deoxyglucuronate dehydrogenase